MPRAFFSIRGYPATLFFGALIFALTLVLTASSLGKVGIGGPMGGPAGGEDEGSGFGGTGRSGAASSRGATRPTRRW